MIGVYGRGLKPATVGNKIVNYVFSELEFEKGFRLFLLSVNVRHT